MTTNKLPQSIKKQKINPAGLNELAKKVREILNKEDEHVQKEIRNGDKSSSRFNYLS